MTNSQNPKVYDLEERTAKFGEDIIRFAKKIPKNTITFPIIGQLVRAGTSVGSNYCEADDAESKMDFKHKIGICKKRIKRIKALAPNDCRRCSRIEGGSQNTLAGSQGAKSYF